MLRLCAAGALTDRATVGSGELIRAKSMLPARLAALAVMVYGPPITALAVAGSAAIPLFPVVAVKLAAVKLGPLAGALKVTTAPGRPLPPVSARRTLKGLAKVVVMGVLWPLPAL